MKRFLSIFLPALICGGSLLAQTSSTVTGVWKRGKPKVVKMFSINNGNLSEIASTSLADDGSFSMTCTVKQAGYYVLGLSASAPAHRYTFYMKPGDPLSLCIDTTSYQLMGKDNTLENVEMTRWHDFIFPVEDKAIYFMGKNSTYVDFFPLMEEKLTALSSYKAGKTKNKMFDASFADFRKFDMLSKAIQFVMTPRAAHPQDEDFIDYYRQINLPELSRTTAILSYPGGLHLLVSAYMNGIKFSDTLSAEEKRKRKENMIANLFADAQKGTIANDTIKGELALMFGKNNKTLTGLKEYQEKYAEFIVTNDQKERWEQLRYDIMQSMDMQKEVIDFKFPDVNGKEVSLSDFLGKVVYIDIWATWCGPCKKELPHLKTLEAEYKDNKDIVFMGVCVNISKEIQKWKDFLISEQLPGVQLFAGDKASATLSKPYKITGIPRFMLVGRDGKLIYMDALRPSSPEIRAALNEALKK